MLAMMSSGNDVTSITCPRSSCEASLHMRLPTPVILLLKVRTDVQMMSSSNNQSMNGLTEQGRVTPCDMAASRSTAQHLVFGVPLHGKGIPQCAGRYPAFFSPVKNTMQLFMW